MHIPTTFLQQMLHLYLCVFNKNIALVVKFEQCNTRTKAAKKQLEMCFLQEEYPWELAAALCRVLRTDAWRHFPPESNALLSNTTQL